MPHITEKSAPLNLLTSKHWLCKAYPEADTTLIDLDLEQQFELLMALSALFNLRAGGY